MVFFSFYKTSSNKMSCAKCLRTFRDSTESWSCSCQKRIHPRCLKVFITYANTAQCSKELYKVREAELTAILPPTFRGRRVTGSVGTSRGASVPGGGIAGVSALSSSRPNVMELQLIPTDFIAKEEEDELPDGWEKLTESIKLDSLMLELRPTR